MPFIFRFARFFNPVKKEILACGKTALAFLNVKIFFIRYSRNYFSYSTVYNFIQYLIIL